MGLAFAIAATACASDGSSAASGGGLYGGSSTTPSPAASATGSSSEGGGGYGGGHGGTGSGGGGGSARTVRLGNYLFSPSTPKVDAGDSITFVNGTPDTPHTFTVEGEDIDVSIEPGSSEDVKIDLAAGSYPFVCRFHEASGMTGTLTVT